MFATVVLWITLVTASWMQAVDVALVILVLLFIAAVGVVIAAGFEIARYSRALPSIVCLLVGLIANPATLLAGSGVSLMITGNPAD